MYNGNGQQVSLPSGGYEINVENLGYKYEPTSFFGAEKSAIGNGANVYVSVTSMAFPNTYLKNSIFYCGVWAKVSKACKLRIFNGSSYSDSLSLGATKEPYGLDTYRVQVKADSFCEVDADADTWYYLNGVHDKNVGTSGNSRSISVCADLGTIENQNGTVLTVKNGVIFNATDAFGEHVPDAETIKMLLSDHENYYFSGTVNLWNRHVIDALSKHFDLRTDNKLTEPYVRMNGKGIEIGTAIDENWEGWGLTQNNYGQNAKLTPLPIDVHGKVVSDAGFSCVPLYGQWSQYSVTTGNPIAPWGGHFFHGWNNAMTYRLTMMASGGMTAGDVADFVPREDEFCLHVFSPHNAVSQPVNIREWEANHRITPTQEDTFSGGAYYGRLRIGADKADEGFLFQCKRMTCFGLLDVNGKKFILGDQSNNVPSSSNSNGEKGQVAFDDNYYYVCVSKNTWKRFALETW